MKINFNSLDTKLLKQQDDVDVTIRVSNLEPLEYCRKWVAIPQGKRGWRKASIASLIKATGLNESTISNWGKDFERRPDSVLRTLYLADKLNEIRQVIMNIDL